MTWRAIKIVGYVCAGLLWLPCGSLDLARADPCDRPNMSMAEMRNCVARKTEKQIENLKDKACSASACLYKLTFCGFYRELSSTGESRVVPSIKRYCGFGYTFIDGINFPGGEGEGFDFGQLLLDPTGQQTIVGTCGGTACVGGYSYVRGPLKGADLSGPFGNQKQVNATYWVLSLPR